MSSQAPSAALAVGRRERRKAETRRRLLAAARELFVERGYDATRPQDIARVADVAAGTFYVHFADKREAFLGFTDQAAHELMERVHARARGESGFDAGLRASLEAVCEYADANPGVLRAALADEAVMTNDGPRDESLRARLAGDLAQSLRRNMMSGEVRSDFDPELIGHAIVGLVQQALSFGHRRGVDRREMIDNLTRFCSRALARTEKPSEQEIPS